MADWSKPVITSNYVTFVDEVRARDVDVFTMLYSGAPISPPVGAVKLLRTPTQFEQWTGAAWSVIQLGVAGGGTGSNTAAGARTSLGLGTMATQNANAVAITGGNVDNIAMHGSISSNGATYVYSDGRDHALNVYGPPGGWAIQAVPSTGHGGVLIHGTQNTSSTMLHVRAADTGRDGIKVRGDMQVYIPHRLVIPIGTDMWAVP